MADIIFFNILSKKKIKLKSTVINATSKFRHHNIILQNKKIMKLEMEKWKLLLVILKINFLKKTRIERGHLMLF